MAVNTKKEIKQRKAPSMDARLGRIPPQDIETEKAILGICLLEKDALDIAMATIEHEDIFYKDAHVSIYAAMLKLYRAGVHVDLLTITAELHKNEQLESIGGAGYLAVLVRDVVTSAHLSDWCKIVYEKYMLRELIRTCGDAISEAYAENDPFDIISALDAQISTYGGVGDSYPTHIGEIALNEIKSLHERIEHKVEFNGISSGYPTLDRITGGWQSTDLIIIAARPAVGKTAFTVNLSLNAASSIERMCHVVFFSLEMGKNQIGKRALSAKSGVGLEKIFRKALDITPVELQSLEKTASNLKNFRLHVNDRAAVNPSYIKRVCNETRRKIRKRNSNEDLEMVIIDYLQLMQPNVRGGNREQDVSSISRDLKCLAKDLGVPVIALSQLNRDGKGKPDLSHLRESGAIEQDADMVCMMYGDDGDSESRIFFDIMKHRNGATDRVAFTFDKTKQQFIDEAANYNNSYAGIGGNDKPFN